jgi:hypothetical protein
LTAAAAGSDPCADYGLECYTNPNNPASSTTGYCDLPGEYASCLNAVPCLPGLTCASGIFTGPTCVYECATSADCPDPIDACQPSGASIGLFCYYSICGPTAAYLTGNGDPSKGIANGSAFLGPCSNANYPSAGTDGTCLPEIFTGPDGGPIVGGVCQANGAAAPGASCGLTRTADGGPLCAAGGQCLGSTVANSTCYALCPTDPTVTDSCGPACASGTACFPFSQEFGACFESCSSSSTCGSLVCESADG